MHAPALTERQLRFFHIICCWRFSSRFCISAHTGLVQTVETLLAKIENQMDYAQEARSKPEVNYAPHLVNKCLIWNYFIGKNFVHWTSQLLLTQRYFSFR